MKAHYADDWLTVYGGDALTVLRDLDAGSGHCCVTSPPYWGPRDYGSEGQLGLEPTPEQYVANLVAVFREVRRVLRDDGTLWLNLGDSYSGSWSGHSMRPDGGTQREGGPGFQPLDDRVPARVPNVAGLKPKDLVGIPWRVAFALQADGWYLRSDIIWAKPNPMPESVTDRPTKSHEYLFLLSKKATYYYDADAVAENSTSAGEVRGGGVKASTNGIHGNREDGQRLALLGQLPTAATRNLRSVWTIATRPYSGAHFAVFPPELPERCIKAGCPRNVCSGDEDGNDSGHPWKQSPSGVWSTDCEHTGAPMGGVVLDPFAGSGTVGLVANRLSRRAVLIDLNPAYLEQQMLRNAQVPVGL